MTYKKHTKAPDIMARIRYCLVTSLVIAVFKSTNDSVVLMKSWPRNILFFILLLPLHNLKL